jgi:hypothetical protein
VSLNWNTSDIIAKNYLSKNDDTYITKMELPLEYLTNEMIEPPLDVPLPMSPELTEEFELRVFKFVAQFYLTIILRSIDKMAVSPMLSLLKSYINKSTRCAEWLLREFCNLEIVEENFLQCG